MFVLWKKYIEPKSDTYYKSAIDSTLLWSYSKRALGYILLFSALSYCGIIIIQDIVCVVCA